MPDGINQYWRDGRFDLYICPRNSRPSSKGAPEHHNLRLVVTTNIQQALPRRSAGVCAFSLTSSVTERDVAWTIPSGFVNVNRLADGCHERSTVIIRRKTL